MFGLARLAMGQIPPPTVLAPATAACIDFSSLRRCPFKRRTRVVEHMNKQISLVVVTILLAISIVPVAAANAMGPLFPMMQQACLRGLAVSPQSGLLGSGLGQQALQNQQSGVNQNLNCPSGMQQVNGQCQVINNGLNTNGLNSQFTGTTNPTTTNGISTCTPSTQTISLPNSNAGVDQTITPALGTTVVLDGSKSTGGVVQNNCINNQVGNSQQATGTVMAYSWVQTSGSPTVTLTGANTAAPTFPAPTVSASTPLTFSLTVTDSSGAVSTPTTTVITLNPSAS